MRSVEETVRRAQKGDANAFGDLIAQFEKTALAVAYGVLGDGERSGDAVQEAFMRAWQRLSELEQPERFGAWLCGIVRNLAHDAQRRAWRERRAREALPIAIFASRADDPIAHLEDCENEQRLSAALEKLDEITRTAVVLRYYNGMTSKQIAALLDLPPAAIDMRLSRARQTLRRELSGDEPPPVP